MKLVVIVLNKIEVLDELLEKFVEEGITGATIINSTGMAQELLSNHELNIFYSIRNIMDPERKENRTIYMVVPEEKVEVISQITDKIIGGFDNPNTGIMFTTNIDFVKGVNKK